MNSKVVYLILVIFFISHLPFLAADPDTQVDLHTMGAWTDEGLYSAQARNFISYGDFGIRDNTTFIRGPLQTFFQVPVFFFFGTSLQAARLMTLIWVCVFLLLLAVRPQWNLFVVFLIIFAFMHFRVYHFSHYALAEMMAVSSLIVSFLFLSGYYKSGKSFHLFLSALMVFVAWGLKIQFLYFAVIPPVVTIIYAVMRKTAGEISFKKAIREVITMAGFSMFFLLFYILIWYLPNKEFYDLVMFEQIDSRFDIWNRIHLTFKFNFNYFILKSVNLPLICASVVAFVLWVLSFVFSYIKIKNHLVIIFGLTWLTIELHKLGMTYLPQRYLLGLYVAAGFFSSAVFFQLFRPQPIFKYFLGIVLFTALVFNGIQYFDSLQRRTYELRTANDYLLNYDWHGKTIAGVWAPSITWKTQARAIPVWREYADPETFFQEFDPALIVAEPNEGSSGEFFKRNGFNLEEMSDSIRFFDAWRYDFKIYWLKE
jgi:hypothetical protein